MTSCTIPKVIHYCWFGGAPLGEEELACIDSWKRMMPDYEIKRWDESNFDVRCCSYCHEAFEEGLWAFVSDYARFKILHDHGGVYLDTDVEIIKPIDALIEAGPFMGFQDDFSADPALDEGEGGRGTVAPGLGMAAPAGMPLYREILDDYESRRFRLEDGSCDVTNVVDITTEVMLRHGLREVEGIQHVAGVTVYPAEYFNPKDSWTGEIHLTDRTHTIHHFSMSWLRPSQRAERRITAKLVSRGMAKRLAITVGKIVAIITHFDVHRVMNIVLGRKNRN